MVIVGLMEREGISNSQVQGKSEHHLAVMRELSEVTCIPAEIMEETTDKEIETKIVMVPMNFWIKWNRMQTFMSKYYLY